MKRTGIVRKLDELGRITLPMELRRTLDIGEREPLEIFVEEDSIVLKKYLTAEQCVETHQIVIIEGTYRCKHCSKTFTEEVAE